MIRCLGILFFLLCKTTIIYAGIVKGRVTDEKGEALPFASIYLKGTSKGTTTNAEGYFNYELQPGNYTLVCRYIGYHNKEIEITIGEKPILKNITLIARGKELKQVVVKVGEDPALRIIRKTIQNRSRYYKEIDKFKANAYIKGNIRLVETNESATFLKMFGMSGNDSSSVAERKELENMKGILYLSESFNEIAYMQPDQLKIHVKSSKVSGNQSAYGFSEPIFANFYENNVRFGSELNPRGFISPIAETALFYYTYSLLDTYHEDGKTISIIEVIPRRKYEPLFAGQLHIIEEEWRLHSVDLATDKLHQLDVFDSILIKQIFVPVGSKLMVKDQQFRMVFKLMGFGFSGEFLNVFSDYEFDYDDKKTFDRYVQVYDQQALSQSAMHWDSIRPVPLNEEELADYRKKDSTEQSSKINASNLKPKPYTWRAAFLSGYSKKIGKKDSIILDPFLGLQQINWNTVEGFNYTYSLRYKKQVDKDRLFSSRLTARYGFSNQQFNTRLSASYTHGKSNKTTWHASGGRYVFQYNNEAPVNEFLNSYYTLFEGRNYMKLYTAWFSTIGVSHSMFNGLHVHAKLNYQHRQPLPNSNLFSFRKSDVSFTSNFPTELLSQAEPEHRAWIASLDMRYQPGRRYIKFPDRIIAQASKYPTFHLNLMSGLPVLNSDVHYNRWQAGISDDINLKLWGTFMYRINIGGFAGNHQAFVSDYTHFNGNQLILASPYLNSFQLSPYYANSNTEKRYATFHAEHHFYGMLTNKIPLFRKLNWQLVGGTNAYLVNRNNNYIEVFGGLENIGFRLFRFLRVDLVAGYQNLVNPIVGLRIGVSGSIFATPENRMDD
jgi:hypothetical protein